MFQPEPLKSDEFQPWSRGRGTDVWAMFCAARDGNLATVKSLAAKDARLVECEFEYRRPLHFAVRENQLAVVEFLLDSGADPTWEIGCQPALSMARDRGYHELTSLLETRLKIDPEGKSIAEAIRSRDIENVRAMLGARPELVHAADERGNQPIHWAVMTRQLPLIAFLLESGADINGRRPDGARPLDLTNGDYFCRGWRDVPPQALRPHGVLIGYLLARGSEYDISVAAKIGDLDRVRTLLDQNPELVNKVPPYSAYYSGLPLRCAAAAGHLEVVKLLLDRGANPNEPEPASPMGGALYEAIRGERLEIVKLLLEHGANPNAAVESSGNCLWAARDNPEIANLVASYGGVITLDLASYDGNIALVGAMLHANPALHIGEDSLHYAMENGHQDLLALMLRHQPDVLKGVRLGDAKTPELARWLIERGMDPGRANWLGITPLHRFAGRGNRELAAVCLESGADINPIDDEFCSTPLGWAARDGQTEMVRWLLEKGADRRLPHDQRWAHPIEWAKRRGHHGVVALLER
jgi:ankyrin repeat protein